MAQNTILKAFLKVARVIDTANCWIGEQVSWLILVVILVSAGNAISRKLFSVSSNAWLEIQWLLFGAVFLICSARVLSVNKHVRVDLIYRGVSPKAKAWVDLLGHLFFLVPLCILVLIYSIPFAVNSYAVDEQSINPGGLPLWPAKMLIPLGFTLLLAQAFVELIRSVAELASLDDPLLRKDDHDA